MSVFIMTKVMGIEMTDLVLYDMDRFYCIAFILLASLTTSAQATFTVGVEQDVLPWLTGGYFANVWAGKGHVRARALVAHVRKPDFILPDGFANNTVTAYALVGDYFLKENWVGPWIGAGLVKWESTIQDSGRTEGVSYSNWLLNGSLGYNWKFFGHFYAGPWAGLHLRMGGDTQVKVAGKTFHPPLLNPEASLKVGWHF